ncbi:MAG: polysaccharide biosynthesis/export family protein [Ahrensia sp.]|nr:polysaccharide biosynthesis/export family protein [Ahrensia sp.]
MTFLRTAVAFSALTAMAACTGYRPAPPAFHEVINQPYLLDSGDQIRVTVFDQGDLSNTFNVDQSGYISFPLVGSVAARGRTVQQMEAAIAQSLKQGYLRDPDVSVEVAAYRTIFVMGEVGASGQYAYRPGMTVQMAVAGAGGFSARANQGNADITRQINGKVMTGRVLISDPIMPGDTIYVRERIF